MPSFKTIVGGLFGLLIAAVIVLGTVSYRYNEEVVQTSFWINHTHRAIEVIDEISSEFREMQLESNAIFIKHDTSRVDNYHRAKKRIFSQLDEIRALTVDNLQQRMQVDSLDHLMASLVTFTDSAFPASTFDNPTQNILNRLNEANNFRDKISGILMTIKKREMDLLRDREGKNSISIASFNDAFSKLLAGIGLLIIVAFFSIRYNFNKLLKIDEQLRVANEKTEKALAAEIELNKLKSNFVSLASHEFRTPLTTVMSSAALLENYAVGSNEAKITKHIARIRSSVNSLTSILDEFLSLSRIEEGRMIPNFERLDIRQYLVECISNLQNFAKPGQQIIYNHSGENEVETDPVFIGNIINNLVTNSIKYSPENSTIYVTSHFNEVIQLSVRDNGMGIPKEDLKHLFGRFYRASNAGNVHGTGLGLHIMKHYVDMLNGTVKIDSEVGKGTNVVVTLKPDRLVNENQLPA